MQYFILLSLLIRDVFGAAANTVPTTTTLAPFVNMSPYDQFLAFPPEYVALLGLGICFILLFIVVIIIICITGRANKG